MKTVKRWLFKKYSKGKKSRAQFCLSLGWYMSGKKYFEKCNSVGAGVHKIGKVISFSSNFDPNFANIWGA